MVLTNDQIEAQNRLKTILQGAHEKTFEHLVAALTSRMIGIEIAVAGGSFQFGGDGGTAGRQGRRIRIETKRYSSTNPNLRELTGEIVQALQHDSALEGWFLAATREVPEQVESTLNLLGEELGIPVVVMDCKKGGQIWSLTALCTVDASVLDSMISKEAGDIARSLSEVSKDALDKLRRDCESWQLGFETLRSTSLAQLDRIWSTPSAAIAKLGQDAAVGNKVHRVPRRQSMEEMDSWWSDAITNQPVALVGLDGVGKTWSAVDWLVSRKDSQPIVVTMPASFLASGRHGGVDPLRPLLAEYLQALTQVRSVSFWEKRLTLLLKRPVEEGPVLTLLVDGLNQVSEIPWLELIRHLQDEPFAGRVRLIVTTRTHHFEDRLRSLKGLVVPPKRIGVGTYDDHELDAMLEFEGLRREDLHPELIPLARRPRLFALVIKFRDRLVQAGSVTPHRLLWEYGKDTLGPQSARSFTEQDWREWLKELADRALSKIKNFTSRALSESAARPDLTPSEIYGRLSDLIDGDFVKPTSRGFEPTPAIVAHALGLALLNHLDEIDPGDEVEAALDKWLDAIAGLDERAEILRAAVSIMVARDTHPPSYASSILLSWLQSQNLPEGHIADINGLARSLTSPLLDAIEHSNHVQRAARLYALNAIRTLPRDDAELQAMIFETTSRWLRVVPRDEMPNAGAEAERARSEQLRLRIGTDTSGEITVLGSPILLVDRRSSYCTETVPSLMEGFPLARAVTVFEAAAIAAAINTSDEIWEALKWLNLLNPIDREVTSNALRERSRQVLASTPEKGIHPDLVKRVAALLLWLTSDDEDGLAASSIGTPIYRKWDYEGDYAVDPGRSFLALERRHATSVLADQELSLHSRLNRGKRLILDPTFEVPPSLADEIVASMKDFPVEDLDAAISPTMTDIKWEQIETSIARAAPTTLASLLRTKLNGLGSRPPDSRYWLSARIREHVLLWDEAAVEPARTLRESPHDTSGYEEVYAASNLAMIEVLDLPPIEQTRRILDAGLGDNLDLSEVLGALSSEETAELIAEYGGGDELGISNLSTILLVTKAELDEESWKWMLNLAFSSSKEEQRSVAFLALWQFDSARLGADLLARDWAWQPAGPHHVNHYGSLALADAADAIPFDQLAPRLAPWLLLRIASRRGESTSDMVLAAELTDKVLRPSSHLIEDLPVQIVINLEKRRDHPFAFSLVTPPVRDRIDPIENWRAMMDTELVETSRKEAVNAALARIADARKAGADLLFATFDPNELRLLFRIVPKLIEVWSEGADQASSDFNRRVRLSYGFYLGLCEAALEERPQLGATLWRALRKIGGQRVLGASLVDELIHIPFRVSPSSQADALLKELFDLANANTDMDLFELTVAADVNGRSDWLDNFIAKDAAASETWRQRRAEVLSGFRSRNAFPVKDAWPEGQQIGAAFRRHRAAKWLSQNASADHWWRSYVEAPDAETALGCWVLLLNCADRRSLQRINSEIAGLRNGTRLGQIKRIHVMFNMSGLVRAMEKREKGLEDTFLGERTVRGISPWL